MKTSSLIKNYIEMMTLYLQKNTNLSNEQIDKTIKDNITKSYKSFDVDMIETNRYGDFERRNVDLLTLCEKYIDKVITPSGSFYERPDIQKCIVADMVAYNKIERSKYKKKMYAAEGSGNTLLYDRYHSLQSMCKIDNNSLSGAYDSKYNVFFDKPSYNAITSIGRTMISATYCSAENVLEGNFAWYNEEYFINHLTIILTTIENEEDIKKCVTTYKLKHITKNKLFEFVDNTILMYKKNYNKDLIKNYINNLSDIEIQYVYYYNNLKHIMRENTDIFKNWIIYFFNLDNLKIDNSVDNKTIFNMDKDLTDIICSCYGELLDGKQLSDLVNENHPNIKKIIAICNNFINKLKDLDLLFNTFIYKNVLPANLNTLNTMYRRTTVTSDTDSIMITTKNWVQWFTGDIIKTTSDSYKISSLMIYLMSKVIEHVLFIFGNTFSIESKKTDTNLLEMKNEYVYGVYVLFNIKKTYAGLVSIKEGTILNKPKADIKGGLLKGSELCKSTIDFNKDIIVNYLFKTAQEKKISASELVKKIIDYECKIIDATKNGELTYLKQQSIKFKNDYKDHLRTFYFSYMLWNEVFGEKYTTMQAPLKVYTLKIFTDVSNLNTIRNVKIRENFFKFKQKYNKFPSNIAINPRVGKIPIELVNLIDMNNLVHHNTRALYMILDSLKIGLPFRDTNMKQKLLLSDLYDLRINNKKI